MGCFHFWKDISRYYRIPSFFGRVYVRPCQVSNTAHPNTQETNVTTITKIIASVAILSALAAAPASARFDSDEGGLSAHAQFSSAQNVNQAGR